MTIRALRTQHARAFKAWESTKAHRWAAEVSRLNLEIMKRSRPRKKSTGGEPRGDARNDSYLDLKRKDLELARKRSHLDERERQAT